MPVWAIILIRAAIFIGGQFLAAGKIPTGVDGLGSQIGALVSGAALLMPAGQKNQPQTQITGVVPAKGL